MPEITIGPILSIRIPLDPPSVLLPNARRSAHWTRQHEATAMYRMASKLAMMDYAPDTPITGRVSLGIHVAWGHGRRTPDLDAIPTATKGACDALADAGIIQDDRQITSITVGHEKLRPTKDDPKPQGWTELRIVEME